MAITYPLTTDAFIALLRVQAILPQLMSQEELSQLGSGDTLAKDLGPQLWTAVIQTLPMVNKAFEIAHAGFDSLRGSQKTFNIYSTGRWYPQNDPGGTILGSSTVEIAAFTTTSMSLKGLPANYKLSVGDKLSFAYGSAPVMQAYHTILEAVTADGSGNAGPFDVSPYVRSGAAINTVVSMKKPYFTAIVVPGSFTITPRVTGTLSSFVFQAQQVFF